MMEKKQWHIKVYIVEEYFKEAETKEEAINMVNIDGNPVRVNTVKVTAKIDNPKPSKHE